MATKKPKAITVKDLINSFCEKKAEKEGYEAQAKECSQELARLEADIMEQMANAGVDQVATDKATCSMKESEMPAITDWDAFYAHVQATGEFELLHKRLSSAAFSERREAGEVIPGTTTSKVWKLSVRRK